MAHHLDFDKELDLSVPEGVDLASILVDVEIIPNTASCLIFGLMADGHTKFLRLRGGHSQVKLPFAHRKVYLKYLRNITEIRIGTIGYMNRANEEIHRNIH